MLNDRSNILSLFQQYKIVSSQANYYLIFATPLIITFIINLLIQYQLYSISKNALETIAPLILAVFLSISFARFALNKNKFFIWAGCLLLVLFIREIHPPGSSLGVYVGILALLYIAHKHYSNFPGYFQDARFINLIAMGFFTYFIAVTIDQRFWKFIPGEDIAHVPLEESLEVIGHILIGYGLTSTSNQIQHSS
jgi:hypothetical protein